DPGEDVAAERVRSEEVRRGRRLEGDIGVRRQRVDGVEERHDQRENERQDDDHEPERGQLVLPYRQRQPLRASELERAEVGGLEDVGGLTGDRHQPNLTLGSMIAYMMSMARLSRT